jgi:hypothetical protein
MHNSLHIEITDCSALSKELTCLAGCLQMQRWWTHHSLALKGIVGVLDVFPEHPDTFMSSEITDGTIFTLNEALLQNDVC